MYDLGLTDDEVNAVRVGKAATETELAAMIVGESELKLLGRWGGRPAPRHWAPR